MGAILEKNKLENFDNMKIGFCLEFYFRQNQIYHQINDFVSFIRDNSKFLNFEFNEQIYSGLNNFSSLFYDFTDFILSCSDFDEKYCKFHKDFY